MPGIFISLAISFLLFLYAPVDLYCANVSEFWFDFSTLLITALGMFAACFAVLMVLYLIAMLIHQYVYRIALAGGLTLFICTYIQGNFMIDKLPPLDGTTIKWENYTILRTEDLILWSVALLIVVLMYVFLKKDLFSRTVMYLSGGLTLMLLITAVSVVFTSGALQERARYQLGGDNEFVMSDEQNFIILVLDTVDSRTFAELLETHPEYAAEFQDFTYFENTVGAYSCTERAVPYILSGEWYENDEPFEDYMRRMYRESPLFRTLQERGYRMEFYDEELYLDDEIAQMFSNVYRVDFELSSYVRFAKPLLKLVGFRYAPFELKKKCIFKMAAIDELVKVENAQEKYSFSQQDHIFKSQLDQRGISEQDTQAKFQFIHLNGAHVPFIYDENMNIIDEEEGTYEQAMLAVLSGAGNYVEKLRGSGAYDNTVLIIMADHGYNGSLDESGEEAWMRQCPLLLIKGMGETHDTMQISQAPISFEDLQEAYTRLLDGKQSTAAFDWKEGDVRERRFLKYSFLDEDHMQEYVQTGYAFDRNTMKATGREYNR